MYLKDNLILTTLLAILIPVWVSAQEPDDDRWDDRFGGAVTNNGVDDEVFALAADNQFLYVGGDFSMAGKVEVSNIARWDGEQWRTLGQGGIEGTNGPVFALGLQGEVLYAGGQFTQAGGRPSQNIARYSVSTRAWAAMPGGGISGGDNPFISTILVVDTLVYVGGNFQRAGNIDASNVAVFNTVTQTWSPLGSGATQGVDGNVNAIANGPDGLYVGGSFSTAGGIASNGVARFSEGAWHSVGGGVGGYVNAISVVESSVFVGGGFNTAGDSSANNVARWYVDSSSWSRLTGLYELTGDYTRIEENGVNDEVRTIIRGGSMFEGEALYFGGAFTTAFPGDLTLEDINVNYVARWYEPLEVEWWQTNIWWGTLGRGFTNGTNGFVNAAALYKGQLYVGGSFSMAGGAQAMGVARYDGRRWHALGASVDRIILAMAADSADVFVGGEFSSGGSNETRLAYLDGETWIPVNGSVEGTIYTIAMTENHVYVGGQFDRVNGRRMNNVARWDRQTGTWSELDGGVVPSGDYAYVAAIEPLGDRIIVGGWFDTAGTSPALNLAEWNATTGAWNSYQGGVGGAVLAIEADMNNVYVGGRFGSVGAGTLARNIAAWDGSSWSPFGAGTAGDVYSIAAVGENVYVGGSFDSAGSIEANNIARFNRDGDTWHSLGQGITSDFRSAVNAIAYSRNYLYATGTFRRAGGAEADNIARWNGWGWVPLGSGLNSNGYNLEIRGREVLVAGSFTSAGAKPSLFFGIYDDLALPVEREAPEAADVVMVHPNPAGDRASITFSSPAHGPLQIRLYDARGGLGSVVASGIAHRGQQTWRMDLSGFPTGTYLLRLELPDGRESTGKVIIVR